jgi:hypothetical protein
MSLFKSSAIFAASGLLLAGLAPMADAAYVVGPIDFGSPYTVGAINGQQGWVGAGGADVTNADGNAAPALFIDNSQVGSSARKSIPAPYNTDTTQTMRVKYDIYGTLDSSTFTMPMVQIGDLGGSDWAAVMIEGMAAAASPPSIANKFRLNGDSTKIVSGIDSLPNVWYTVTVDLSFADKEYDVTITDGTNTGTASDVPFWYDSLGFPVPGLNAVLFRKPGGNTYPNESGYIDNFSVEMVPEPTALSLLGLGALAMIRRRK